MAKIVDITDKLAFDENPKLKIKDIEVEVNADAETMLKMMGAFGNKSELQAVLEALRLLFSEKDQEKIVSLKEKGKKLSSKALMAIVKEAMNLIMGEEEEGEQ